VRKASAALAICLAAAPVGVGAVEAPRMVRTRFADSIMLGGEWRLRPEGQFEFDLRGDRQADQTFVDMRTRLDVDVVVRENLDIFVRIQDSRRWGQFTTVDATATTFLKESWISWSEWLYAAGLAWDLRAGRQVISIADERLVGALDWSNIGRSFDALRLDARWGDHGKLMTFASIPVEGNFRADQFFYGLVVSPSVRYLDHIDLWFLGLEDRRNVGAVAGDREIYTAGGALRFLPAPLWAVDLQGSGQWGRDGRNDHAAWAGHARLSYRVPIDVLKTLVVEYNYASGDRNAGDRRTGTFNQLFPTNHDKYGFADLVGYRNIHNLRLGARGDLGNPRWLWGLDFHWFRRDRRADDFYTAAGAARGLAGRGAGTGLGTEFDAILKYVPYERVEIEGGYGIFHLDADLEAAIRATGGAPTDADHAYLMTTVVF
jgi:hypothetical protein